MRCDSKNRKVVESSESVMIRYAVSGDERDTHRTDMSRYVAASSLVVLRARIRQPEMRASLSASMISRYGHNLIDNVATVSCVYGSEYVLRALKLNVPIIVGGDGEHLWHSGPESSATPI